MTAQMTANELHSALAGFNNGTEAWYQHALSRRVTYTDGAKFLADHAGAYWLLDEIVIRQPQVRKRHARIADFQHWELRVKNNVGTLACDDGNGNVILKAKIPFTDFPLDSIELFYATGGPGGTDVIMLPSEY